MAVVSKTSEGKGWGDMSCHHAVKPIDVFRPVLTAPIDTDYLLYHLARLLISLALINANALQPR